MSYYKSEKYYKKGHSILKRYLMSKKQTIIQKINKFSAEQLQVCSPQCSCKMNSTSKKRFNFKLRNVQSSPKSISKNDKIKVQSNVLLNDLKSNPGTSKEPDVFIPSEPEFQTLNDIASFAEGDSNLFQEKMNLLFDLNFSDSKNESPTPSTTQLSSKNQPSNTQTSEDLSHIGCMEFFSQEALVDEKERLQSIIEAEKKYILKLQTRKCKLKETFEKNIIEPLDKKICKVQSKIRKHSNTLSVIGRKKTL